jgi:mycothiol synthase
MNAWTRLETLSPQQRNAILTHLQSVDIELGRESIDEQRRRVVLHGGSALHFIRGTESRLDGYAQANFRGDFLEVEMAGGMFDPELADSIKTGGQRVHWWIRDASGFEDLPPGAHIVRSLDFMTGPLPSQPPLTPSGISVRTFEPASDSLRWLALNNEAFAAHPEQGVWTERELSERLAERWFDPSGFLLFERSGALLASCWTKIHELNPDRLGEIYVICVSPAAQGEGLGKLALTHGLASLRFRGAGRGALYVETSNEAAVGLYQSLGFATERRDLLVAIPQ